MPTKVITTTTVNTNMKTLAFVITANVGVTDSAPNGGAGRGCGLGCGHTRIL